jgi:DNA replicative helicase MCM subunit Mcm2 (Cdc46/Mcm family)
VGRYHNRVRLLISIFYLISLEMLPNGLIKGFKRNFLHLTVASLELAYFSGIKLFSKDQILGNLLLLHSRETIQIFEEAAIQAQNDIVQRLSQQAEYELSVRERIMIRWHRLPYFNDVYKTSIPKSCDANKLVMVRGTVVRAQSPKLLEWEIIYQCQQCRRTFPKPADLESYNHHPNPTQCQAHLPSGAKTCASKRFEKVSRVSATNSRDYQEIKLQEQVQHLNMGAMPRSVTVVLMDEMVGKVNAGDDVTITGLVTHRWGMLSLGEMPELELMIIGSHIEINNERRTGTGVTDDLAREFKTFWADNGDTPLLARDAMLRSICPEIFGMYNVKLAIAMVLAGGVRLDKGPTVTRGDSHLLMIGDPGTGKSQLLRFAAKMANRSVLTTGVGTTGAGLTATAIKENGGEWALEAGALVLADGGACCIDEFASIHKDDQTSIHEAMEQQTIHMAKAGLVCELHTRCAVIAATNPKSKYNTDESVSMNVALGGPLLSRFDVVLVLLDEPDELWDKSISSFILQERTKHKRIAASNELPEDEAIADVEDDDVIGMFQRAAAPTTPQRSSSGAEQRNGVDGITTTTTTTSAHGSPSGPGEISPNQRGRLQQHQTSPQGRPNPFNPSESPFKGGGGFMSHGGYGMTIPQSPNGHTRMDVSSNAGDAMSMSGSQAMGFDESNFGSRTNGVGMNLMTDVWPVEKLQSYLAWVKACFKPKMSMECRLIGTKYYARQRQSDMPDAARTTARLAESFVRICQGHAKLMARHHAIVQDAIYAIVLLESSTFTSAIGGQRFPTVRSFFPVDPDVEYYALERTVLKELGLLHLATPPNPHHGPLPPPSPSPSQASKPPPLVTGNSQFYAKPPQYQQAMSRPQTVPSTPVPSSPAVPTSSHPLSNYHNGSQQSNNHRYQASAAFGDIILPEESRPHSPGGAPTTTSSQGNPRAMDISFDAPESQNSNWGAAFRPSTTNGTNSTATQIDQPNRISTPFKPSSRAQPSGTSPVSSSIPISHTSPPSSGISFGSGHPAHRAEQALSFRADSGRPNTSSFVNNRGAGAGTGLALTSDPSASNHHRAPNGESATPASTAPPIMVELVPIAPNPDDDFGKWDDYRALVVQAETPSASQMDLDQDFLS